ncbi:Protein phosphatase 2C containing protein [Reticulomyxa filosa]|uniref:Protein phosphatase 2C containing protein n=1 Tax=Reticulomyxa filosa TaxID=46433 RepID=X6M1W6_RETFI|nr:Protein phosphatase 2C containing protein [Reticulomyxa filosa]|eukprot:ETO06970.1 Protein phosphatase 2C containing protein [Reticulomyxa filosa]
MKREGATGTLLFRDNNTIWCGNVGDSKAVLARRDIENGKLKPLQLSKDHTVLQLSEVRRVEACGGHVANGRVNGILEVTRSFGDPEFKKYGVISVPQISKFQITNRDEFVVVACDGLWSVFSIADCIKFVNEKLNHKSQPDVREVVRQLRYVLFFKKFIYLLIYYYYHYYYLFVCLFLFDLLIAFFSRRSHFKQTSQRQCLRHYHPLQTCEIITCFLNTGFSWHYPNLKIFWSCITI